jgi:hypothetical protein
VPWLPGIAHPTGYPLFILLGWLWSHSFAIGEVAWRMNLLSAIFGALTVGVTYAIARRLLDDLFPDSPRATRILVSIIGAGAFAISPTFWSQAVIAEVYALHSLFVAILLGLALKWRGADCKPHSSVGKLLVLTYGVSLTHHRTTILLLPALLLFWWWHYRHSDKTSSASTSLNLRLLLIHGLLLIAPLLLYLYLPLIAPFTPYTTLALSNSQILILYDNSVSGFWQHVMGSVFTGELRPSAAGVDRLLMSWQLLVGQVGWIGVILALFGLVMLWNRRQIDLLLLTGLGFLAFVTFNLIYFVGDIIVFFIPAWLFICLWLGIGLLGIADIVAKKFVRQKTSQNPSPVFRDLRKKLELGGYQWTVNIAVLMLLGFLITTMVIRKENVIPQNSVAARDRWQQILSEPIPQAAVLLSNDRNEIMPMWYYQYVEKDRPDLLGIFPLIVADPAYANVGRVLDQALASERPVYLIKPMAGLGLKADLQAEGSLFRASTIKAGPTYRHNVTLPEITLSGDGEAVLTETINLAGYDAPTKISPGDEILVTLYWQPVQPLSIDYSSFVHLITDDEQGIAQSDHQPGEEFYPSRYWQVGEILRDQHALTVPTDALPGQYRLRVGFYYQPQPGQINSMGNGEVIGLLTIDE